MTNSQISEKHTILRCIIGSTLYGTANEDSDVDEMGVCIEPIENTIGFTEFEQDIHQSRTETGVMITESKVYSLRKFLRLALAGNPDVTPLFFVPAKFCTVSHAVGRQLQDLYPQVLSRLAGSRFLGYMTSQRQRMLGEQGQKRTNRPELIEKYGYDTKYAMQLLRLGIQGLELLTTGYLILPMQDKDREYLLDVRNGKFTINSILQRAGGLERLLKDSIDTSPLPKEPNTALIEDWMVQRYWEMWKANRLVADLQPRTDVIQ
jgi:hypothetical protein